jgi:hypothetical protein
LRLGLELGLVGGDTRHSDPPSPPSHHLRNVRRAKQQMCMCQTCTNFKGYQRVLCSLPKLFEPVTHPPVQVDAEAATAAVDVDGVVDGAADPPPPEAVWDGAAALDRLLSFCGHEFKSAMVADALCAGALDLASCHPAAAGDDQSPATARVLECLNGRCSHCGFKKLWSQGLRKQLVVRRPLVDGTFVDDLRSDAPVEFQSKLTWTRIRCGAAFP